MARMDLNTFLTSRRADWRRLEELLARAEGSGLAALEESEAIDFGRLYRRAASDLNQAQTFARGDATAGYLNDLVARAYLTIYGKERANAWAVFRYYLAGYPAHFRRHWPHLLLATALFVLGTVFGYLAVRYDGDVARAYLLPSDMPTIQPPKEGEPDPTPLQTTGQFTAFSSHLFTNNLGVSLAAFALGMTLGVGSAWLLFYNGVMLGALWAVFVEAGQLTAFATGILPHGVLEIPAALLGGAAGFVLAQAVWRARPWPRREEMARAGKEALLLAAGCVPLLAAAAVLEAGVARAPDWFLSRGLKLAVASVVGLAFAAYVLLPGWGERRDRP
jgi:uncharacterized membrane protein SpoIIM required for sporulation